jgi:hypothetical protein
MNPHFKRPTFASKSNIMKQRILIIFLMIITAELSAQSQEVPTGLLFEEISPLRHITPIGPLITKGLTVVISANPSRFNSVVLAKEQQHDYEKISISTFSFLSIFFYRSSSIID